MFDMKVTAFKTSAMLLALAGVACQSQSPAQTTLPHAVPVATLQELMHSVIDPNVDPLWNAVTTTVTQAGVEEKAPSTDAEWASLRQHALLLIEAGNLLLIPNRTVAVAGASTSIHPVEEDPKAIEALIKAHPEDFGQKALALQTAVKLALVAIDEKNPDGLLKAGEGIEHACEACHAAYWYPNDKRPEAFKAIAHDHLGFNNAGYFKPTLLSALNSHSG